MSVDFQRPPQSRPGISCTTPSTDLPALSRQTPNTWSRRTTTCPPTPTRRSSPRLTPTTSPRADPRRRWLQRRRRADADAFGAAPAVDAFYNAPTGNVADATSSMPRTRPRPTTRPRHAAARAPRTPASARTGRAKPILIAVAVIVALLATAGGTLAALTKTVTVTVDGASKQVTTLASDVEGALSAADVVRRPARHAGARRWHVHLGRIADRRPARSAVQRHHRRQEGLAVDHGDHRRPGHGRPRT